MLVSDLSSENEAKGFAAIPQSGDKKADEKKKAQKSSPELRDLVRVFLGFSPEVHVNFRRFFPFVGFWGIQSLNAAFKLGVQEFGIIERGYRKLTLGHVRQAQRCVRCTF